MDSGMNRKSKIRWSIQPSAIIKLPKENVLSEVKGGKGRKEKLLQKNNEDRAVIPRGSIDSCNSKSGQDSDFDLEDSGYLDTHLASIHKQAMTAVDLPSSVREKKFRGLNYDVIGDVVCIRGESKQGLLTTSQDDVESASKTSDSSDTVALSIERDQGRTNFQQQSKEKLYSLGFLNHGGSFSSNASDSFSSVRHNLGHLSIDSPSQRSPRSPMLLQSSRSSSQRDLSTTSSICSDDSVEESLDTETSRLSTVLEHIDPARLHSHLQRQLKSKNRAMIMALSTLLPRKKFTAETMHCVRCHKEFNAKYGVKTCTLVHPESSVEKMFEDDTGADFACESCGTVFRAEGFFEYTTKVNKSVDCGFCFVGAHTFEAEEVEYRPDGIAKTCEDNGCVVFYV